MRSITYKTSDLAEITGLTDYAVLGIVRHYPDLFDTETTGRKPGEHRFFTERDLETIKRIKWHIDAGKKPKKAVMAVRLEEKEKKDRESEEIAEVETDKLSSLESALLKMLIFGTDIPTSFSTELESVETYNNTVAKLESKMGRRMIEVLKTLINS